MLQAVLGLQKIPKGELVVFTMSSGIDGEFDELNALEILQDLAVSVSEVKLLQAGYVHQLYFIKHGVNFHFVE